MADERTLCTRVVTRDDMSVRLLRAFDIDVLSGIRGGLQFRAESPSVRVGSHDSNDLCIADDTLSKHHLEIAVTDEGYRVTDLASTNGTFIGALRLGEVFATEAVTLRIGACTLRIKPARKEVEIPASRASAFGRLCGRSVVMRELYVQLEQVAKTDVAVLLEGETGVGKEVVAQSIHDASPRKDGPFIVVDCGALAADLVESELFGHVRGAFTGANENRAGLLEAANGGTLFLDEIGDLPLALQAKLLGVLERRRVTRIGATTATKLDLRVIAASHHSLSKLVNEKKFRADLFYRLAVVRLKVPPLRERLEDIPQLVQEFLRQADKHEDAISAVVVAKLQTQPWPGNVRELRNAVERALAQLQTNEESTGLKAITPFIIARDQAEEDFERAYFKKLLAVPGMNLSRLARETQLDRRYLQRILRRRNLSVGK
jgi:two-component system response regulator GlrR